MWVVKEKFQRLQDLMWLFKKSSKFETQPSEGRAAASEGRPRSR